jgi:hypothetical protein
MKIAKRTQIRNGKSDGRHWGLLFSPGHAQSKTKPAAGRDLCAYSLNKLCVSGFLYRAGITICVKLIL